MTDTDPLTPIEALADEWVCDDPGCDLVGGDFIRVALTEARQAVDALVVERDAARAEIQNAVLARNSAMRRQEEERRAKEGNIAALNTAVAERDAAREALARVIRSCAECGMSDDECCTRCAHDLGNCCEAVQAERERVAEWLESDEAVEVAAPVLEIAMRPDELVHEFQERQARAALAALAAHAKGEAS